MNTSQKVRKRFSIPLFMLFMFLLATHQLFAQQVFQRITTGELAASFNANHSSAWGDYDNDGDQDVVITSYAPDCISCPMMMFSNNGQGEFERVFNNNIVNQENFTSGLAWGDYDNDGKNDLMVCGVYNSYNYLFHNNGNGQFTKVTGSVVSQDYSSGNSPSWIDYDKDGDLDLYVTNNDEQRKNFFYDNNGDGTFSRILNSAIVSEIGESRGCAWGDYNNDGWPDLFVANFSGKKDFLYKNNGNGTFQKITTGPHVNDNQWGTSCAWVDVDNDGWLDLFVTNLNSSNRLYRNVQGQVFESTNALPATISSGWGFSWIDYNNDGLVDLVMTMYSETTKMYKNLGNFQFSLETSQVVSQEGLGALMSSSADFNLDGRMDLLLTSTSYSLRNYLYKNVFPSGNYVMFRLRSCLSNKSAIGARVRLYSSGLFMQRIVQGGGSFTQDMQLVHFGLGNMTTIDSVTVEWPYQNLKKSYRNLSVNSLVNLDECVINVENIGGSVPVQYEVSQNYPNPFNPTTTINFTVPKDSDIEILLYSLDGKKISTILNEFKSVGNYKVVFGAEGLSSGAYYYAFVVNGVIQSAKKMIFSK